MVEEQRKGETAALDLLNEVSSAEELARRIELPDRRDVGLMVAEHILQRREELGGKFSSLDEVDAIEQVGPRRLSAILTAVGVEPGVSGVAPDRQEITPIQAERLSALAGLNVEDLRGATIAGLADRLKWEIDPELLFFKRVCGRVVKTDPVTGVDHPVPFATVHVEDTDCSFFGLFPFESPWAWFFPFNCRREEIATVTTDRCGRFCVWIPRFEIDWILRWRLERHCYPELLVKPSIRDILEHLKLIPEVRIPLGPPRPDPPPYLLRDDALAVGRLQELVGGTTAKRLLSAEKTIDLNEKTTDLRGILDRPAFTQPPAPPIPPELAELQQEHVSVEGHEALGEALARRMGVAVDRIEGFDLGRHVGPFLRWRCQYEFRTEIVPIFDVPDITFRVSQDVDSDGTEETIYSEGFFDVRWNAGAIPDVSLHASQIAVATSACDPMPEPDCSELGAGLGIASAGFMPLSPVAPPATGNDYYDPASGYARRPNRPHADGAIRTSNLADPPATAPFSGTLLLRGCNQADGAEFYRMWYSFNGGPPVPFLNHSWPIFRPLGSVPTWVGPDPNGWYPILPDPANWLIPYLLLSWPSYLYQPGLYDVYVELGDGGKNHLDNSASVKLQVDNSAPRVRFTSLSWHEIGGGAGGTFSPPFTCCVVNRPLGSAIEFTVGYEVLASHLLDARLAHSGCGSGTTLSRTSTLDTAEHWHTGQFDNTVTNTATFELPFAPDNQGAYSFSVEAWSRTFNPSDPTGYTADWNGYDVALIGGTLAYLPVAVVNA